MHISNAEFDWEAYCTCYVSSVDVDVSRFLLCITNLEFIHQLWNSNTHIHLCRTLTIVRLRYWLLHSGGKLWLHCWGRCGGQGMNRIAFAWHHLKITHFDCLIVTFDRQLRETDFQSANFVSNSICLLLQQIWRTISNLVKCVAESWCSEHNGSTVCTGVKWDNENEKICRIYGWKALIRRILDLDM